VSTESGYGSSIVTRLVLLTGLVLLLNVLLLRAPAPPPGTEQSYCVRVWPLGHGFRIIENCDSQAFVNLARSPGQLLTKDNHLWQSRPLYIGIASIVARPLGWLRSGESTEPEYVAFILMNLALVTLSALFFQRMMTGGAAWSFIELAFPLVVIAANDVTKAFFWTPHLQMFNLFVPCLTLWLGAWILLRGRPLRPVEAVVLGLALGLGLLMYGALMITVASVALAAFVGYRRLLEPILLLVAFVLPFAMWYVIVLRATGEFYSHEIAAYRQFVWLIDCARLPAAECSAAVRGAATMFVAAYGPAVGMPLLLLGLCRLVSRLITPRAATDADEAELARRVRVRAVTTSVACYLAVATPFLALMGFYAERLGWLLVPAILALIALELSECRRAAAPLVRRGLALGVAVVAIVYIGVLVLTAGPYS